MIGALQVGSLLARTAGNKQARQAAFSKLKAGAKWLSTKAKAANAWAKSQGLKATTSPEGGTTISGKNFTYSSSSGSGKTGATGMPASGGLNPMVIAAGVAALLLLKK